MAHIRLTSGMTLLGAFLMFIGTLYHPPLTNPWDVSYAFHKMTAHHHWILDHWIFFLGLVLWLMGLTHLSIIHSRSKELHRSGGLTAAICFTGSLINWSLILSMEIAVLPPLADRASVHIDSARMIWDALFTLCLFGGYIAMGFVYIGIIYVGFTCTSFQKVLAFVTGWLGLIGIAFTLLFPDLSFILQLATAPFPYLWTIWFAFNRWNDDI